MMLLVGVGAGVGTKVHAIEAFLVRHLEMGVIFREEDEVVYAVMHESHAPKSMYQAPGSRQGNRTTTLEAASKGAREEQRMEEKIG